ncbi:MAG: DUF456 domain-containing protein [Bowdeniella nasicola]|nr:DUF456 domain-containing protein [Bowdeniella nasicola]
MSTELLELGVGIVCALGIAGSLVQLWPGMLLVAAAVTVWGITVGGAWGWGLAIIALVCFALIAIGKYLWAGKRLTSAGVPKSSLIVALVCGLVGFFVIPVAGAFVGFALGIWASEYKRLNSFTGAKESTVTALTSMGLIILLELVGSLLLTSAWALIAIFAV